MKILSCVITFSGSVLLRLKSKVNHHVPECVSKQGILEPFSFVDCNKEGKRCVRCLIETSRKCMCRKCMCARNMHNYLHQSVSPVSSLTSSEKTILTSIVPGKPCVLIPPVSSNVALRIIICPTMGKMQ